MSKSIPDPEIADEARCRNLGLSGRGRGREFAALTDDEIVRSEEIYSEGFSVEGT